MSKLEAEYNRDTTGEDIEFRIGNTHKEEGINIKYLESSPMRQIYVESSDVELDAGSIDSIAQNADFVQV